MFQSPTPDLDPNLHPAPGMAAVEGAPAHPTPAPVSQTGEMPNGGPGDATGGPSHSVQRDVAIPKLGPAPARTATSATDGADPKVVAGLFIGLVGIGLSVAAVLVKRANPGRKLRRPTEKQVRTFGTAVADLALRFVELDRLSPALVDGIKAAGAVGQYIEDGPLTVPDVPDAGVPAGLADQED